MMDMCCGDEVKGGSLLLNHNSNLLKPAANKLLVLSFSSFASFAPHALKGQKLLAQGIALGYYGRNPVAL